MSTQYHRYDLTTTSGKILHLFTSVQLNAENGYVEFFELHNIGSEVKIPHNWGSNERTDLASRVRDQLHTARASPATPLPVDARESWYNMFRNTTGNIIYRGLVNEEDIPPAVAADEDEDGDD